MFADLAGGLEAVHLRHADVDERDVGGLGADELEQFLAVGCLADHLDAVGHVEVSPQALAHQRVVVRDRNLDRHVPPPEAPEFRTS